MHPSCYQDSAPGALHTSDDSPLDISTMSPIASDLADNLINRRTERARNILVHALMQVQTHVRRLMFKYIEVGVAARGYSVPATMGIIDAVKVCQPKAKAKATKYYIDNYSGSVDFCRF